MDATSGNLQCSESKNLKNVKRLIKIHTILKIEGNKKSNGDACSIQADECSSSVGLSCQSVDGSQICA